jgi:hypothetical protein
MAKFEEHCEDCVRELDEPFPQVHLWLDDLFKVLGPKHRDVRHHSKAVEEIRLKWGSKAARAAEIHIMKDYGMNRVPTEEEARMMTFL